MFFICEHVKNIAKCCEEHCKMFSFSQKWKKFVLKKRILASRWPQPTQLWNMKNMKNIWNKNEQLKNVHLNVHHVSLCSQCHDPICKHSFCGFWQDLLKTKALFTKLDKVMKLEFAPKGAGQDQDHNFEIRWLDTWTQRTHFHNYDCKQTYVT